MEEEQFEIVKQYRNDLKELIKSTDRKQKELVREFLIYVQQCEGSRINLYDDIAELGILHLKTFSYNNMIVQTIEIDDEGKLFYIGFDKNDKSPLRVEDKLSSLNFLIGIVNYYLDKKLD